MGFFKKITRPISRVLDKIIPNEIKPALPYLAAAAPFLMPTGAGAAGIFNSMAGRASLSGGANLLSQLSQEGNEGEVNPLSLLLATGTGAMTTPDAASTIRGVDPKFVGPRMAPEGILNQGRDYLAKGAEFLGPQEGGATDILSRGGTKAGINKETAKALALPVMQGTMDNAYAQQNLLNKQSIIDDALGGLSEGFSNADASDAIRLSMLRYGFSEDEISETITSAGYKAGGRVGKMNGGIMNAKRGLVNAPGGYAGEGEEVEFGGITEAVKNVKEDKKRAYMELLDTESIDREADLRMERLNNLIEEGMSEDEAFKLVMPNAFSNDGKTDSEGRPIEVEEKTMMEKVKNFLSEAAYYAANPNHNYDKYGRSLTEEEKEEAREKIRQEIEAMGKAKGGIIGLNMGGSVLPSGREMDYRQGGMIPMGSKERADDVPARLSKNEFVMTADAVRAAGGGSVNQGAKRMYNLMNNLEARA